jgi:hypothetical protein
MARFQAAGFGARSYLTDTLPAESLLPHPREPSQLRGGGNAHFEPDFGSSSQVFQSFPLCQPTGRSLPARTGRLESHPYFRNAIPDGSAIKDFDGSLSIRVGRQLDQNITQRDAKRPKERSKDRAYKQRFSMVSSGDVGEHRLPFEFQTDPRTGQAGVDSIETPAPTRLASAGEYGFSQTPIVGRRPSPPERITMSPASGIFENVLVYSGNQVIYRVWDSMSISQLCADAGTVFGLNQMELVLVLFSGVPTSLQRGATIAGPPRVVSGSFVMVFHVPGVE